MGSIHYARLNYYDRLSNMIQLNKKYVYHYTSFESAVKIISSGVLLFSRIDRLNDIHEVNGPLVLWSKDEDGKEIQEYLQYYSQISLTIDGERKGFDIPAMWGHYADRGHGVCLVFDWGVMERIVGERGLYSKSIDYGELENPGELLYDSKTHGTAEEFLSKAKDVLFFRKSSDWEYEQEYRIIAIDSEYTSLEFGDALTGAIIYSENQSAFLSSPEYKALKTLLPADSVYRYGTSLERGHLYDAKGNAIEKEIVFDFSSVKSIK